MLLFFYGALQWHLESLQQMTLCPRIRKTVGVSLLQECACHIPPLCILALVQLVVPKKRNWMNFKKRILEQLGRQENLS